MMSVILFAILCVVYFWFEHCRSKWNHKLPPAFPGELPIIGHAHMLLGNFSSLWNKAQVLAQTCNDNGGVIYGRIGWQINYIVSDPDDARIVANKCLQRHFAYDYAKPWLGNGLFTSSGAIWQYHRKLLLPAFSLPVIYTFMDVFNSQAKKLTKEFEQYVGTGQIEHSKILKKVALETFCLTFFGIGALEDTDFVQKYTDAVDSMLSFMMIRFQRPWLQSDLVYSILGYNKKQNEIIKTLGKMSDTVIKRKKIALKTTINCDVDYSSGRSYKPLLDLLLELSSEEVLTDKEIGEEIDTAIVGGFDTTSNTLITVLVMLGANPEVQEIVYAEIMQVVGKNRNVQKTDIRALVYLEAVILETLRMYPIGPILPRYVNSDVKLKNYTLRAGTYCSILPLAMHRNNCWKDRFQFNPKRWIEAEKLPKNLFAGFSIGKRNCIDLYGCLQNMADFCLSMGGVTCGYFAGDIYYGVADPEDALMVCNTVTKKHELYRFANPFLGNGLLTSFGDHYKHHRKLLLPAFSAPTVNGFLGIFNYQSKQLVQLLDDCVGKGLVDPSTIIRNLTLKTSCMTVFGDSDDKDSAFLNMYNKTIDRLLEVATERIKKVWLHNDYIYSLTKLKEEQDILVKILNDTSNEVIQRKKTEFKNSEYLGNLLQSESINKTFIDVLIEIAENGSISDDEIRDELNTAVVASFETTSQQLLYASIFIGTYPEIQEKLYQEIMEVVGDRDVEKQDINKLVYLSAVIKECLRLVPPILLLPRSVDRDVKLKNYTLRAGTQVIIMPGGIHRNKNYWGSDVDVFRPERWLEGDAQKLESISFGFSNGKRSCVGRKYAMTSIPVTLVHMIRNFRFKADYTKMKFKIDVVTRPVSGHEIIIERRSSKYDENHNISPPTGI